MLHKIARKLVLIAFGLCTITSVNAQKVVEPSHSDPDWNRPQKPFRMAGNLYYVGTYDLSSYLITTAEGNILINTGLAASEKIIKENIEALGFKYKDTKILLTMQGHYDHMGAMAAIQQATGAKFMVDAGDEGVVKTGGRTDYELGGRYSTYKPVKIDRRLHDRDTICLGDMKVVLLHHPGHTIGSCSYIFDVKDDQRSYRVLLANMPSIIISRKFSEVKTYPGMAQDFAYTLDTMPKIQFDLWACAHASQFDMHTKHKDGDAYNPLVFSDRTAYLESLAKLRQAYERKLAEEKK